MRVGIIGSGAREHAIARALNRSPQKPHLYCLGSSRNPGIIELCNTYEVGNVPDVDTGVSFARTYNLDFVVVGPEAPLANGISDELWSANIPCIGPKKNLAKIETSKGFTRELLRKYHIPGGPRFTFFNTLNGVQEFLDLLGNDFVVKYDGLMGGKGVKVSGEHLNSHEEAIAYCSELIDGSGSFVIEEKFTGEEFSLMSFCDGDHLAHMIPVQDHKRAFNNDTGPNTGGMGSYTDANHSLPFLSKYDIVAAQNINQDTARALKEEFGEGYKGILYGGFMATEDGVKLIEYNARFGDPEAMNLLAVLESDFVALCISIINGNLEQSQIAFQPKATVCKYAVPNGYPEQPVKGKPIDVTNVKNMDQLYYASVDIEEKNLVETGSRTVAVVGIADTITEAEKIAEKEIQAINGPLFHRTDIGTPKLIRKRINHMASFRNKQ